MACPEACGVRRPRTARLGATCQAIRATITMTLPVSENANVTSVASSMANPTRDTMSRAKNHDHRQKRGTGQNRNGGADRIAGEKTHPVLPVYLGPIPASQPGYCRPTEREKIISISDQRG